MPNKEKVNHEFELDVEFLDLDEVSAIPETTASSGSTSCSATSTCGSIILLWFLLIN